MKTWIIKDWMDNQCFDDEFKSFDDAEEFLSDYIEKQGLDYDEERQEYEIVKE